MQVTAGRMHMEEGSERSSLLADLIRRKTELFAIQFAEKVSTVLDLSAGSIAHLSSEMMAVSVPNLLHMGEVLDTQSGMRTNARETTQILVARNGVQFGIPNAEHPSTM